VSHPLQSIACHEAAWQEKESKEMDEKQTTHEIVAHRKGWLADGGSRRDFLKLGAMGVTGLASSAALAAQSSRSNGLESGSEEKRMADRNRAVEDIPVVLECSINETGTMPYEPKTAQEHITEMTKVLDAGAAIAHNHAPYAEDPNEAAQFYADVYRAVLKKHPHAIVYPTVNLDLEILKGERRALPPGAACAHHRVLAEAGLTNMVMLDTSVSTVSFLGEDGIAKDEAFFVYQFWPEDVRYSRRICTDFGCGAAVAVYEPGWMKNVVAMARAGTLPRGSKLNLFFGFDDSGSMPPPIPEALELYLKMMEGLDLKWAVGCPLSDRSIMDTPLARMALERGGHLRVGLEDHTTGPTNVEQLERAKELVASVGRPIIHGADAIRYLDIPFPATRPE
jgi:uncharacterized protein (DUF849 family)